MSERGEAKRDGAKQQKNSGRGDYQKGDATWRSFVGIIKSTKNQSLFRKIFGLKFVQTLLKLVGINILYSNSYLAQIVAKHG